MSKLPIWLPPGAVPQDRRVPVFRIEGVEEGSPEAATLAERFAGSLRQFYVGQARNHALGLAPQTNTRVDRGDHQIEYLNMLGQEYVTLRVHPSKSEPKPKPKPGFVPMEFLELRIRGEVVPGEEAIIATYVPYFYAQGLYDADNASDASLISSTPPIHLPPGVAVVGYPFQADDPRVFGANTDNNTTNARLAWLDLRGFHPTAVVGVDIYVYHSSNGFVEQQIVGSEIAASAFWGSGDPPDSAPFSPGYVKRFHDSTDWIATQSRIRADFPEYASLSMTPDSNFGFNYITTPLNKGGVLKYGTYLSSGSYLGNPPPRNAIAAARASGGAKALETWPGTNHPPYNVSYGPMEYYPGTEFPRKQPFYYFYNSVTGDDTDLADPPSAPSWVPAGGGNYNYSCEIGIGYVLHTTITDLVIPPRPLQFDIWALGRMGGVRDFELDSGGYINFGPEIGVDELPLVAQNIRLESTDLPTDQHNAGYSVANHFNGVKIGTVYADRKTHAVSFVPAS